MKIGLEEGGFWPSCAVREWEGLSGACVRALADFGGVKSRRLDLPLQSILHHDSVPISAIDRLRGSPYAIENLNACCSIYSHKCELLQPMSVRQLLPSVHAAVALRALPPANRVYILLRQLDYVRLAASLCLSQYRKC